MPKLLEEVRNVARLRHLSLRTERAYTHYIAGHHPPRTQLNKHSS